jgi:hypothetical protein
LANLLRSGGKSGEEQNDETHNLMIASGRGRLADLLTPH